MQRWIPSLTGSEKQRLIRMFGEDFKITETLGFDDVVNKWHSGSRTGNSKFFMCHYLLFEKWDDDTSFPLTIKENLRSWVSRSGPDRGSQWLGASKMERANLEFGVGQRS